MEAERFDTLARVIASRPNRRQILGGLLGGLLARSGLEAASAEEAPPPCASQNQLTQATAERLIEKAEITWVSSGNCSDRTNRRCTSFEGIRQGTVDGIIGFKSASGCDVVITGGTETGHASGEHSHGNGYKVDLRVASCIDEYVDATYVPIVPRGNGDPQWRSPAGDIYAREADHWDITYIPKPGPGESSCGDGCCSGCLRCEDGSCVPAGGTPPPSVGQTAVFGVGVAPRTGTVCFVHECGWTGTWITNWGEMRLAQAGNTVVGDYDWDQGQIDGTVTGRVLRGTWTEAPSRQPPSDAGDVEFTLSDDCQAFTGRWRYGGSETWQESWHGERETD